MLEYTPDLYEQQLQEKHIKLANMLSPFLSSSAGTEDTSQRIHVHPSPKSHFRMRAEFRIWHEAEELYFAMFPKRDSGKPMVPFKVEDFPIGSQLMNQLMQKILPLIKDSPILKEKLFQMDFLTTTTQEAVISLLYHKKLEPDWEIEAERLKTQLGNQIHLIGRSRKQKHCLHQDFVTEKLKVNGSTLCYQQVENSFTQPNSTINIKMLEWAQQHVKQFSGDLLELYCGNGNFTIALAPYFRKVLATEISKTSVNSARHNFKLNNVDNVDIVRISSEELSQHVAGLHPRKRLHHWDQYQFSSVLVDPPRSGLDPHSIEVLKTIDNILYISCNPETLVDNLAQLSETHVIQQAALFDQFPYTHHIETGLVLTKKTKII